jgi:hypothetical protein
LVEKTWKVVWSDQPSKVETRVMVPMKPPMRAEKKGVETRAETRVMAPVMVPSTARIHCIPYLPSNSLQDWLHH